MADGAQQLDQNMTVVRDICELAGDGDRHRALRLLDHSGGLIGIYDDREHLRFANAAFRDAYAITPGEVLDWSALMRRNYHARRGTIIATDDIDAWIASVRSRRGKLPRRAYESDLHDGRWIWVVETMLDDGWIVYSGMDVSDLRQSERHLRHARDSALREAQTDALTGIANRRFIMDHVDQMAACAADRRASAGFLCLLDIDHFKAINDTRGHVVGDKVLTAFARRVRQVVRLRDGFGRVGGEEFLLLLPDVGLAEAEQIMSAISAALGQMPLLPDMPDLHVTFSAGICAITPGAAPRAIYAAADEALYQAKVAGRNRTVAGAVPQMDRANAQT